MKLLPALFAATLFLAGCSFSDHSYFTDTLTQLHNGNAINADTTSCFDYQNAVSILGDQGRPEWPSLP